MTESEWRPIATAPENMDDCVVVRWTDSEGQECREFDYTEDGCWMSWHNNAEHVEIIGGHGASYTPPYEHWLQLPPKPKSIMTYNETCAGTGVVKLEESE